MQRGRLITVEGLDGAGKTTVAKGIADHLQRGGLAVTLLREPGGVETSERIRELVKDPALTVAPRTEALLYAAARAQLVEQTIRPLIDDGAWVLLDRFVDSSLAYQGVGRGIGVDAVKAVNVFATGGLIPDRTLLLRIDQASGRARQAGRGEAPDRLEAEQDAFFDAIAAAYDRFAQEEPARWRILDATAPPDAVLAEALEAIGDLLPSA